MSRLDLRAESDVRAHTQTRAHTRAAGPEAFEAVVHRTHTRARARAQLGPEAFEVAMRKQMMHVVQSKLCLITQDRS